MNSKPFHDYGAIVQFDELRQGGMKSGSLKAGLRHKPEAENIVTCGAARVVLDISATSNRQAVRRLFQGGKVEYKVQCHMLVDVLLVANYRETEVDEAALQYFPDTHSKLGVQARLATNKVQSGQV